MNMQLQEVTDTPFEELPLHLGAVSVMGIEGDIKYTWDPKKPDEVNAARLHFAQLKEKGFAIFKMKRWRKSEKIDEFDPKHGRLLFVSPEEKPQTAADAEHVKEPDVEAADHYVAVPPMQGG